LLTEFEKEASIILANNQNFPLPLLTSNSKYENKEAGAKELYQGKIIPEASIIQSSFNSEFQKSEGGQILEFDFSDIIYLQGDKKSQSQTNAINTKILIDLNTSVSEGKMDRQTAINTLVFQGFNEDKAEGLISQPVEEIIPDDSTNNVVIPQEQLDAQANLRGSVGGVQGVLAVQLQVSQGITDLESAIAILEEFYGLNEDTARRILGTPNPDDAISILEDVNFEEN